MLKNSDTTMKKLWLALSEDAIASTDGDVFVNPLRRLNIASDDLISFRERCFTHDYETETPYKLKWEIQLDALFKRYKFAKDPYQELDLEKAAAAKFIADQLRISGSLPDSRTARMVVVEASKIVRGILGSFKEEEHAKLCKLSSHANCGVPYNQAFFDIKVKRLTGSVAHLRWFKNYLKNDSILNHAVHEKGAPKLSECDCLRLAKVPKSWKAARTMMPHTVIGSFYTNGLGSLIQQRLLEAGVDIRHLQDRHKMLARKFSVTRTHATADLSSASDSFNRELLCRLLPRSWYRAVMLGNPRYFVDDKTRYSLQSPMTMGMGHTFPLQTLLFSCLLKAVQNLSGVQGLISVYGDDLIYPRRMHKFVVPVFRDLNFRINTDKTFVTTFFRESCGGDYYRGVDVRPFSPQGECQMMRRKLYLELLYKLLNGLRLRWEDCEIPHAIHYLITEIVNTCGVIHQVPPSYPATAGLHSHIHMPSLLPWSPVKRCPKLQCPEFTYLRQVGGSRTVMTEGVHYWHALRRLALDDHGPSLYGSSRPNLRLKKRGKGKNAFYFLIEDSKTNFQLVSQTGRDSSWS